VHAVTAYHQPYWTSQPGDFVLCTAVSAGRDKLYVRKLDARGESTYTHKYSLVAISELMTDCFPILLEMHGCEGSVGAGDTVRRVKRPRFHNLSEREGGTKQRAPLSFCFYSIVCFL
jgi:hypothetical protein